MDERERLLFERLSVFQGGRTIDAVDAVCCHDLPLDVLDGLASLLNKNLLGQEEGPENACCAVPRTIRRQPDLRLRQCRPGPQISARDAGRRERRQTSRPAFQEFIERHSAPEVADGVLSCE